MAKFIVLCADGTWNGPDNDDDHDDVPDITNVLKLYRLLACDQGAASRASEQECSLTENGEQAMAAKYLHGVGNSGNPLVKAIGGAFGAGLIARIVRGYTFISRNYAPGDSIILLGFSRGAYTARALAGMICAKGLLNPAMFDLTDREAAYDAGSATWAIYRKERLTGKNVFQKFLGIFTDLPAFFSKTLPAGSWVTNVQVEAVAVWDTVGAMGIPVYHDDERWDAFRFADTILSGCVQHGYHAVSVDEIRKDFTPTLWTPDARVDQALFPGAHADVGGGYPVKNNESGLSDHALVWMIGKLARLGLKFKPNWRQTVHPDALGCAHMPWLGSAMGLNTQTRAFPQPPDLSAHHSLRDRMGKMVKADPTEAPSLYAPSNPTGYFSGGGVDPAVSIEP